MLAGATISIKGTNLIRGNGQRFLAPNLPVLSRRSVLAGLGCALASSALAAPSRAQRSSDALIAAARRQVGVTLAYDAGYTKLAFPNGDVPRSRGVCTDVVIRAYRDAFGLDLQLLVNADMRRAFGAYPASIQTVTPRRTGKP